MSSMTNNQTKRPTPINSGVYDEFTREVGMRFGLKEGIVKESIEKALSDWIKKSRLTRSNQENFPIIESI